MKTHYKIPKQHPFRTCYGSACQSPGRAPWTVDVAKVTCKKCLAWIKRIDSLPLSTVRDRKDNQCN